MTNSFNVEGSAWHLKQILSANVSVISEQKNLQTDIFSPRLIRGRSHMEKMLDEKQKANIKISADVLVHIFGEVYSAMKDSRASRKTLYKKFKGLVASVKIPTFQLFPNLTEFDQQVLHHQMASYAEIINAVSENESFQDTSEEELFEAAWQRLQELIALGTGAIEVKSGYGLDVDEEVRIPEAVHKDEQKQARQE